MDILRRQTTDKHNERIEKYILDTALANDHEVAGGNIERLFAGVRQLFLHILLLFKHFSAEFTTRIQYNSLDRSYSRLMLWYDVYRSICSSLRGEVPPDFTEAATRYLKGITLTLVDRFIHLVSKEPATKEIESLHVYIHDVTSLIHKHETACDDDSDDASNFDYDSYTEVAEDLKTDTTCLVGLNSLIDHPSLGPTMVDEASCAVVQPWELYQPYCDRISNRFPEGTKCVISRLGRANYNRYIRWIQRNNEVDNEPHESEETKGIDRIQQEHTVVASAFHDSGLGSSVPSKSSYAETVMSYGTDGNGQSVRVPPLSEEAKQGAPFTCVACFKTVSISNNSLWKRHLYEDLCPWMCLDPECSSGSQVFRRRNDWIAHLSFEHQLAPDWASFTCPLCRSETEPGKISITRHLGNHLEEIALGSLPLQTEWDSENDDSTHASVSNQSSIQQLSGEGDETEHPKRLEEDAQRDQYEQQLTLKEQPIVFQEPMSLDMGLQQPRISNLGNSTASMLQSEEPQPSNVSMIAEVSDQESEPDDCCEICGYRPKGDPQWFKGSMAKHKKLEHSSEPPRMYQCTYPGCTAAYKNRPDNLRQHQIEKGHFDNDESRSTDNIESTSDNDIYFDMYQAGTSERAENHGHSQLHETLRAAPIITGPAISVIARAAEPIKGQAWAFPEDEIPSGTSAAGHHFYDVADEDGHIPFVVDSHAERWHGELSVSAEFEKIGDVDLVDLGTAPDHVPVPLSRLIECDFRGCHYTYKESDTHNYIKHRARNHKQKQIFRCEFPGCDRSYKNRKDNLQKHQRISHQNTSIGRVLGVKGDGKVRKRNISTGPSQAYKDETSTGIIE